MKTKRLVIVAAGVLLVGLLSVVFWTQRQRSNAPQVPEGASPGPVTRLGSLSLPAVTSWTKYSQQFSSSMEAVYYKPSAGGAALSAKVFKTENMMLPGILPPERIGEAKVQIEKALTDPQMSSGSPATIQSSQIVSYRKHPALSMVWDSRSAGKVTHIRFLLFNRGASQYHITLFDHSHTTATKKQADQFWQALTDGLRD